jgi:AcrR family transcriptional regulator
MAGQPQVGHKSPPALSQRGAAYSNFTSKEDLFLAALERNAEHPIDETLDLLTDTDSASPADHAQVQARLERNQQWAILFMEFCLQAHRRPELQQRLRDTRQRMRDDFAHRLASLRHASASTDWLPTATAILAMNNGLIIEGICDGTPIHDSANLLMGLLDNLAPSDQP